MQAILDRVATHLAGYGVNLYCTLKPKASVEDVDAAHDRLGLALPDSYIEFITQFANGFELSWYSDNGGFAWFEMATMESSIDGVLGMRNWRFYDDVAACEYGFPYVDDSELALVTNRLMHNWLPIHAEENGDYFSINLNTAGMGCVIFDQHDWLDGGTGHNGFPMASDLPSFFKSWGMVCFSHPQSLRWKSVVGEDGVNWDSNEFDDRFRLNT